MDFLKDKKNLPIVVALAVFVLLGAGGLVGLELGLFSGSSQPATPPPLARAPVGAGTPPMGVPPGGTLGSRPPYNIGAPVGLPRGTTSSAASTAIVAVKKPALVNPLVGADPFKIPNGAVIYQKSKGALVAKTPLRDVIGPLNLFQLRPPPPPVVPTTPNGGSATVGPDLSSIYRLAGIATGTDGISAILQFGDQSQTVKPGDSLPDGTQIQNIQSTSVTLRTAGGTVINLPLSAGTPNQTAPNFNNQPYQPDQPGGGGQPYIPQGQRNN